MSPTANREDLLSMTERELAAFLSAVQESYGPGQAALSADDWLAEFESYDLGAEFTIDELRRVTIAAAARLASRLTHYWAASDTFVQ